MASNNQRAPSAPPPTRWSNESKKNSKEHQKLVLGQVKEMFESILEPDLILTVVQNCKWKLQPSIEALIMLSENAETPLNRSRNVGPKVGSSSSSTARISKSLNREGRGSLDDSYQDKREYKSNLDQDPSSSRITGNSYLNLNDKELLRQQEEFRKFELLKKDLTEKGFVPSENENVSKPSYSKENNKIPHEKLQQFGQSWSKPDSAKVYFLSEVENGPVNATNNQLWSNTGDKKTKETNNQLDNLFGSKLQFSRDLPNNKIANKGTIPKNFKTQTVADPAIITARNSAPKSSKASSAKSSPFSPEFDESEGQDSAQQQVAQFDSNYDNETKMRAGNSKSNLHKGETESLCGLKVQYRLPGLENSSDDDADVVIEEESADYPTQIPSLMSINVCQFISSSTQSPPKNTRPEISLTNTPSPPRSPQHNTYDEKLKSITSSIVDGYKVLVILRGLPGSGKSHLATSIVKSTVGGDRSQFVFSTDDYFVMIGRGVYQHVKTKLTDAHNYNQKRVLNALRQGVSPVIIDNTNTQSWEMQPYVVMGVQHGYMVEILEPSTPWSRNVNELARKNVHRVPKESIRNMVERYERNITGQKLIEQFSLRYSPGNFPPQIRNYPFFRPGPNEGQEKNEKLKTPGSKNRSRRKKKNSGANTNSDNFLLSDSDKNMKHRDNCPGSKNPADTLENIISNALMAENDTLNKSLVDYCIETDSGDEIESDRVPTPQENGIGSYRRLDLLGEGDEGINNPSSSSSGEEKPLSECGSSDPPPPHSSSSSSSSNSSSARKNSNILHQNLGAIGSERKGSVTAIDSDNFENGESNNQENVLSQCWDFTLLLNGKQIHSTVPPRKKEPDFDSGVKNEAFTHPSEISNGVIITEIVDEADLVQFVEGKIAPEDPDTIITNIINKMDALEQETNLANDVDSVKKDLDYEEPDSTAEPGPRPEESASSFGSIFSMIKKSFLGINSEQKQTEDESKSEESIMKYKRQTNDNSLSEIDAFENEMSHREPSSFVIIGEDNIEEELAAVTVGGDSLSPKLFNSSLSLSTSNFEKDLCRVSKPITFDTLGVNQDLEFRVDDTLSDKLSEETGKDIEELDSAENKSKPETRNETINRCAYSRIDSDDAWTSNLIDVIKPKENKDDNLLEIDSKIEKDDSDNEEAVKTENTDSVYDILSEAVNRIISRRETESKSKPEFKDDRNSSDDDESESSQTESSYLISGPMIVNEESKTGPNTESERQTDVKLLPEDEKEKEITSEIDKNAEVEREMNLEKDSDLRISPEDFFGLVDNKAATICLDNDVDHNSSIEECCESCEDCEEPPLVSDAEGSKPDTEDLEGVEKVQDEDKGGNKSPEIIDNINQVTWKESPFPVPIESINALLETSKKLDFVVKSDSSTNTCNYDFNVLYVGGTSEPEYKILKTNSRTINNSPHLSLPEKPPLKLMLDKSSMTSVVDILSGEESLEFRTEMETMKNLDELIEMFPNVPREDITDIYKNLCSCNFNWAVDMLLDGVPEHVTKYDKIEAPKITLVERQASGSDPGDLESQNSTPRKERLDKLKQQSSSSESNDSDSRLQQQHSSPRKKKDRNKVSEESLELKRQIEEKMVMNEASYNPHILRVKRWKNGEPDITSDVKEERISISQTISSENELEFDIDNHSPKSSESNDDFTEDDIEPEEMMELNLGEDFIKVLENQFGNPEFQLPGGLFPVIQIKKSMAQQLHALWMESMELQLNAQQEQLDKMIEKDAEYARSLEQEEARSMSEPLVPNLPEIMDMEMALAIYHNDLKKQLELETPNDMASRLTRQMLHDMFTDYDPETLDEILKAHNGNFKETVDVLEASTGQVVNRDNSTLKKQKSLIDRAEKESMQSNEGEPGFGWTSIVVNPDLGQPNNSNTISLSYEAAIEEAKSSRKEADRQLLLRNENFNKAKEAIRKGNREVAGYYSQMAKLHAKKREWANSTAASAFLAAQDYKMSTENTLDLHFLYVAEALQALDVFLDFQISKLNEGSKKSINLYIITGRGARSSRGLSRIKPAVSKRLTSKNIRFMDENPGCLKVVLKKNNSSG